MLKQIARLLFLRILPRRLVPLLAAWEVISLLRGARRSRRATPPSEPVPGPASRRPPVR